MLLKPILAKKLRKFICPISKDFKSEYFDGIEFTRRAMEEYCSIPNTNYKKTIELIIDIWLNGLDVGIGKPEYITEYNGLFNFWSRRITHTDRLRYNISFVNNDRVLTIEGCEGHYNDH